MPTLAAGFVFDSHACSQCLGLLDFAAFIHACHQARDTTRMEIISSRDNHFAPIKLKRLRRGCHDAICNLETVWCILCLLFEYVRLVPECIQCQLGQADGRHLLRIDCRCDLLGLSLTILVKQTMWVSRVQYPRDSRHERAKPLVIDKTSFATLHRLHLRILPSDSIFINWNIPCFPAQPFLFAW